MFLHKNFLTLFLTWLDYICPSIDVREISFALFFINIAWDWEVLLNCAIFLNIIENSSKDKVLR